MIALAEAALRLGTAAIVGGAIGLNRDLHHKPTGLRTLSLVSVGAALAVMVAIEAGNGPNPASPVIQGIVTGIGFLGAGVIVRDGSTTRVRGLTTAAAIWLTAVVGVACGLALWPMVLVAAGIIALVIGVGGRIEKAIHRRLDGADPPVADNDVETPAAP